MPESQDFIETFIRESITAGYSDDEINAYMDDKGWGAEPEPSALDRGLDVLKGSPAASFTRGMLSLPESALSAGSMVARQGMGPLMGNLMPGGNEAIASALESMSGGLEGLRTALTPTDILQGGPLANPNAFVSSVVEALPTLVAAGGAAAVGGAPAVLGTMATMETGNLYKTLKSQGIPENRAAWSAAAGGTIMGALELVPLGNLTRLFKGVSGAGAKRIITEAVVQAGIEGGEEMAQETVGYYTELLNAEDPEAFKAQNPMGPRLRAAGAVGFGAGLVAGGVSVSASPVYNKGADDAEVAKFEPPVEDDPVLAQEYVEGHAASVEAMSQKAREVANPERNEGVAVAKKRDLDISEFNWESIIGTTPGVTVGDRLFLAKEGESEYGDVEGHADIVRRLSGVEDLEDGDAAKVLGEEPRRAFILDDGRIVVQQDAPVGGNGGTPGVERSFFYEIESVVEQGDDPDTYSPALYRMQRPEMEAAVQRMKGGPKAPGLTEAIAKFKEGVASRLQGFSREYKNIPHGAFHAPFRESMRMIQNSMDGSLNEVDRAMHENLSGLTDAEYDLFIKKRFLDDARAVRGEYPADTQLPGGLTDSDLAADGGGVDVMIANHPRVKHALDADRATWQQTRDEAAEAFSSIGLDTEFLYRRGDEYLHHAVFDAALEKSLEETGVISTGTGLKKPRGRGYQKKLKGSLMDINLRYEESQGRVLSRLKADTVIAREIAKVYQYNIMDKVKAEAKEEDVHWSKKIPEGYDVYQFTDGRHLFSAWTVKDRIAQEIIDNTMAEVTNKQIKKATMLGGLRDAVILPKEMIEVLEHGSRVRQGVGWKVNEFLQNKWKQAALFFPRRAFKYLTRNFVSDWTVVLQGAPKAATNVPLIKDSAGQLVTYMRLGKAPDETLRGWLSMGGASGGLFAQEITKSDKQRIRDFSTTKEIESFVAMAAKSPVRAAQKYMGKTKGMAKFMESVMRYTTYRHFLAEINENGGTPKNYAASIKEEIDAQESPEKMAYWLSNELIGAYDMVSQNGRFLRKEGVPFWSFQELNMRTQYRLMKNAFQDDRVAEAHLLKKLGNTGVVALKRSPIIALRAGRFLALASGMEVMLAVYNGTFFPDEEEDLPENVQRSAHIILGRKANGEVRYFNRLSRFQEFREWFGLAEVGSFAKTAIRDYMDGRKSAPEAAKMLLAELTEADNLLTPLNKAVSSIGPIGPKGAIELAGGFTTFPDATKPRKTDDRWRQFFQMWGLENDYDLMINNPVPYGGKGKVERSLRSIPTLFYYTAEPGRVALGETWRLRRDFDKARGEDSSAEYHSEKSVALRKLKRAMQYGEADVARKWLVKYAQAGGTPKGMRMSLERMDPLYGLRQDPKTGEDEIADFWNFLRPEDREQVTKAREYWKHVILGGDILKEIPDIETIFSEGQEFREEQGFSTQQIRTEDIAMLRAEGFLQGQLELRPKGTVGELWRGARAEGMTGVKFEDFQKLVKKRRQ